MGSYPADVPAVGPVSCGSTSAIIRAAVLASGRSAGSRRSSAAMTGPSAPAVGASGASSLMMADMVVIAPPSFSKGPWPSTAA